MIVLSLFDGISCGNYVLKKLSFNIEKYYSAEINQHAMKVSNNHFPDQIRLGDVNNWREWEIEWSKIDLLIGGSPCQSFSIAGKQEGFNGSSGIVEQYFQILEHIKKFNPKVKFFLENVKMKKEWNSIISNRLGVQPICLDSEIFSAQMRKRLYWFNFPYEEPKTYSKQNVNSILENAICYKEKSHALTASYQKLTVRDSLEKSRRTFVAVPVRENENQEKVVYSVKDKFVYLPHNSTEPYKIDLPDGDYIFRKLTPVECERLQGLPDNYTAGIPTVHRYIALGNAWQCDTIEHIFKNLFIEEKENEKE